MKLRDPPPVASLLDLKHIKQVKHLRFLVVVFLDQLTCMDVSLLTSHDVRVIPDSHSLTLLLPFIALQGVRASTILYQIPKSTLL